MNVYVLGFYFDPQKERVVLIEDDEVEGDGYKVLVVVGPQAKGICG